MIVALAKTTKTDDLISDSERAHILHAYICIYDMALYTGPVLLFAIRAIGATMKMENSNHDEPPGYRVCHKNLLVSHTYCPQYALRSICVCVCCVCE